MKFAVATTLLLGSVLLITKAHTRTSPRVVTPLGLIIGRYDFLNGNRLYAAYEGVPYAESPIGNLRFKVASPVSPWGDALIANRFGSLCLQYNHAKNLMGWRVMNQLKDCLYLNIYTPVTKFANVRKLLPVIFFSPGGAFTSESEGMYGTQYLLDRDVVLVMFNHRLGPSGFLSTEDDTVPGNLGLKDQVVALKWVQDYITYFGGDPSSVTIVGHSAGGVSAQYHYLTNVTEGLFHRGISMSGTALDSWAQIEGSLEEDFFNGWISDQSSPRVETPLGIIEGFYNTSSTGKIYEAYQGIPYATPPIGDLRFELPIPISPWSGVLMAKKFGPSCIQYGAVASVQNTGSGVSNSEDCLYLNIYTPAMWRRQNERFRIPKNSLPVIFYIHGGAFRAGSGMYYGPKYLLNEDVIFVTLNYRLGPLGFLSTEDDTVPGNMGLKDQVIALRWIQNNIESFGGDPKQVTIVGQSAGGAAVQYHFLTNITKGLFRGGMSISGTALNGWTQTESPLFKAKKLSATLGCPCDDVKSMIECLKTRDAHKITQAAGMFSPWLYNPISPFGPVVEKGGGQFTMIDRPPIDSIISGRVHDLPWMTSIVSEDGLFPAAEFVANTTRLADLNQNWTAIGPELLDYFFTIPETEQPKVSGRIRYHYLENRPIDSSTVKQMIRMVTDRLFGYGAEKAARLQARVMRNPVLFYYFTYRGAHSFSEFLSGSKQDFGVSHIDDIAYVLDSYFDPTTTERDREMQKRMIGIWISFATGGSRSVRV